MATRPLPVNGLAFDPVQAESELRDFEKSAYLLSKPPDIGARWRRLALQHNVRGKQAHDTRLVAFMEGHGLQQPRRQLHVRGFWSNHRQT